jgi:hypothetical protein
MTSPFAFQDPRIELLWLHWRASLRPGRLPRREDIDPVALKDVLPVIWIYRLDASGRDFYCALAGQEILKVWGRPGMIGAPISQLFGPAAYETLRARWLELLDRPAVMHGSARYSPHWAEAPSPRRPERLSLPLDGPDGRRYGVLGATCYGLEEPADSDAESLRLLPPRVVAVEDLLSP